MSALSMPLPAALRFSGKLPRWLLVAIAALVIVGLIAGTIAARAKDAVQVVTSPVVQQTLTQSVTASGTVNPQNLITVGTQVSGTISQIDVDYNSKVTKGQVLARIDPSTIQAQLDQGEAQLAQAQASAVEAGANTTAQSVAQTQAQGAGAQSAQAAVQAAQATVQQEDVNLKNTVITSPVTGTVVARDVSIGQTVAASLQTPTLFTIAQNLGQMEVDINVGEPDIGGVKAGDNVNFTVLAYPNQVFHGTVNQVRINPTTVNNVVTYDVVVDVNNPNGQLLPGMTADATIDTASAPNALVVPLSAVHVKAATTSSAAATTASSSSPWGGSTSISTGSVTPGETGAVMVQTNGKVQRVPVTVGLVTSTQAAVTPATGSTLAVGDKVVTAFTGGSAKKGSYKAKSANPLSAGGSPGRGMHGMP